MRGPHTSAPRGKRVRIKLRSGEVFVDRFVERTGKFIVLAEHRLRLTDIVSFGFARPKDAK